MLQGVPQKLIALARSCPYPVYIVGGTVRDGIAGLKSAHTDIDICAPALPEDFVRRAISAGLAVDAQYKNTGTVKLSADGESLEFTCFRSDEYVRGTHKPVKTYFTDDIVKDAKRRDFKCNAVYYDIAAEKTVDPLGGVEDIKKGLISTVAAAEKVFGEDGLRLMRLARIAAQTGFEPSKECLSGARANVELIKDISAERIYTELNLILHADKKYGTALGHYRGLKILESTGVLQIILPELCEGTGVKQREDYHKYDVLEHSLRCCAYSDDSVRLAALLHDVGKPYCFKRSGNFIHHDEEGAKIVKEICARLKVPAKLSEEAERLTSLHMYDFRCDAKENKVRKFIVCNLDIFEKLLKLKQADYSACMDDFSKAPTVAKFETVFEKMKKEGVPLTVKELAVRGDELIAAGLPAAKTAGVLHALLSDCVTGQVENGKKTLLLRAQKVYF